MIFYNFRLFEQSVQSRMFGIILKKVAGSHYIFANDETEKRVTVPFHSSQDVAKRILLQILKDAGISREELQDLL